MLHDTIKQNFLAILKEELIPAMGCTEPIALAYASAKARAVLGGDPDRIVAKCSGNIIKNVRGVRIPNSGGMRRPVPWALWPVTRSGRWRCWRRSPGTVSRTPFVF